MAETCGYGSNNASAPTLANPGTHGFGTAGSRVVERSERDRTMLDEVDDVDWPGVVFSGSWTSGTAAGKHEPTVVS